MTAVDELSGVVLELLDALCPSACSGNSLQHREATPSDERARWLAGEHCVPQVEGDFLIGATIAPELLQLLVSCNICRCHLSCISIDSMSCSLIPTPDASVTSSSTSRVVSIS